MYPDYIDIDVSLYDTLTETESETDHDDTEIVISETEFMFELYDIKYKFENPKGFTMRNIAECLLKAWNTPFSDTDRDWMEREYGEEIYDGQTQATYYPSTTASGLSRNGLYYAPEEMQD